MKKYYTPMGFDPILADRVCDGCGPEGWKGIIIPDYILGVSFREACRIHDYDFFLGGNEFDFQHANKRFLENMYIAISNHGKQKHLNFLRRFFARRYYWAVCDFGRFYFNFAEVNNA
jgi:hypothetical protein